MSALRCPDCGEEITYRSCQQPNTDLIAQLALWVHRREVHGEGGTLDPDLLGGAFAQALDARDHGSTTRREGLS